MTDRPFEKSKRHPQQSSPQLSGDISEGENSAGRRALEQVAHRLGRVSGASFSAVDGPLGNPDPLGNADSELITAPANDPGMSPPEGPIPKDIYSSAVPTSFEQPIPILLHCPLCNERHIDEGLFATKPHHTHSCQNCGHVWRPAIVMTVGVRFLPGFKNG
jgi:hypothetical protein